VYKKIGKGNFASVYQSERLEDNKDMAVKAFSKNIAFNDNFWYATIIYFSALGVLLSLLNYKHFKLSFQNGLVFIAMIGFFLLTLIEPQFFPEMQYLQ
jgi:serine/threonine protein kinase